MMIYSFEDFELDTDQLELRLNGAPAKVEPQVFALLELLVANHHRMVSKDEIHQHIWGGRIVSEAALSSRIRSARQAVGDDGNAQRLIKTVHNRGFRFVGNQTASPNLALHRTLVEFSGSLSAGQARENSGKPSIAVLPLFMSSGDTRHSSMADAITHDIIVDLSRLRWLRVIARGSSFRFRGRETDLQSISQILNVQYFVTGTMAIADSRCLITLELSQAANGEVVWGDSFEVTMDDLLALRLSITSRIVATIESQIQFQESEFAASSPTENLDAWGKYHRGLWHMYRFNAHDNELATHLFEQAIEADNNFARAYAGLSFTHFQNSFSALSDDVETHKRFARSNAEVGLKLDPRDPFINLTMGRVELLENDWEGATSWFDQSIQLNPNYAFAIYNRGLAEAILGDGEKSEKHAINAISLSPIDPLNYAMLATRALSHIVRGNYETAAAWADRAAKQPTAHVQAWVLAALAFELAGNKQRAVHWAARVHSIYPDFKQNRFFSSFPFRDAKIYSLSKEALTCLGI